MTCLWLRWRRNLLNICLVQLLILCHLNFNIPIHNHKSSLPKSPCYHQWKQYIEVSQNSWFIQVWIKLFLETFKIKVNVMAHKLKLCCVVFDELAIKENVSYNPESDEVIDFRDVGKFKYFASRCVYVERLSL